MPQHAFLCYLRMIKRFIVACPLLTNLTKCMPEGNRLTSTRNWPSLILGWLLWSCPPAPITLTVTGLPWKADRSS